MADALAAAGRHLPDNAGAFELAALAALIETMPIDHAAASTIWDPWSCRAHLLPVLARQLSVDLWRDDWPELKKRSVIAAAPELHDLKTSIAGYRDHLAIVECRLVDFIAPPQGFVAGGVQSEEERRSWLRGLPELRLYTGALPEPFDDGFHAGIGYADLAPELADRGRAMAARKARYFDPATGRETPVGPVAFDRIDDGETTIAFESIALPGPFDAAAFHAGHAFADLAYAIPADPVAAPVFTWRVDTIGRQDPVNLLDALPPGIGVADAAAERVPLRRLRDYALFADADFADLAFAGDESASLGFYDAFKLARIGERSGTPLADAGGYADLDYTGWPTHTLHLLVDATGPSDPAAFYADVGLADRACAIADDLTRFDQAVRAAYVASGPSSDHVTLSTEITRFLALSDGLPLDGSYHFGKRILRERA